jgi:fatty acid desaturase
MNKLHSPFPPLADVRKNLRVRWYRSPIDPQVLRALSTRSDRQGWLQAGGHLALFVLTGSLVYVLWSAQAWWGLVLALFVHGTVASFFSGVAPHELGHGTVFKTKVLNKLFLYLFSLISWWDPFDYASSHTYHHRYTQFPEGDRENLMPLEPSLRWLLLVQLLTIDLFSPPGRAFGKGGVFSAIFVTAKSARGVVGATDIPSREWLQALRSDQPASALKSMWWSRFLLGFHGLVLIVAIVSGIWILPLIISFAPFMARATAYAVGVTQHCGLRSSVPDFRKSTRTITVNPLIEFLYWRMNWHIEHHMFAGVPCYNLRQLHAAVRDDMPAPRTLLGAWVEMRETWRQQQADPNYQYDAPLPASADVPTSTSPDDLASSIGDLAPDGLK